MTNIYRSSTGAIKAARHQFGPDWKQQARYLEIQLPEDEMLYAIQQREKAQASPQAARQGIASPASRKPKGQGITARCWAIFDALKAQPRANILDACAMQGLKRSTAATQYQRWKKAQAR